MQMGRAQYLPLFGTAVSNRPTATASADPVALDGRSPSPICHGSRARSSNTDSRENPVQGRRRKIEWVRR